MKHQYVGDINDYRKYGLLRSLGSTGWRTGVCWMLTPNDARTDGLKISYLSKPKRWRAHDPELFDLMAESVLEPSRRHLRTIQDSALFPAADYWDLEVPDQTAPRRSWFTGAMNRLSGADLLFFDPDNGLEVSSQPMGRKGSSKYLYCEEVAAAWNTGVSLLLYQHFPHESRPQYVANRLDQLKRIAPNATFTPLKAGNVLFLLLCQPRHRSLGEAGLKTLNERWGNEISVMQQLPPNNAMQGTRSSGAALAAARP